MWTRRALLKNAGLATAAAWAAATAPMPLGRRAAVEAEPAATPCGSPSGPGLPPPRMIWVSSVTAKS